MSTDHLSPEALSAHLDGVLPAEAAARAERHLAACASCRESIAQLRRNETALGHALEHDPGDAYFETFAARVEDRIRATGTGRATDPSRGRGWFDFLRSPRRLAWVGVAATIIGGAGVVLVTARLERPSPGSFTQSKAGSQAARQKDSTMAGAPRTAPVDQILSSPETATRPTTMVVDPARRNEAGVEDRKRDEARQTPEGKAADEAPGSGFASPPGEADLAVEARKSARTDALREEAEVVGRAVAPTRALAGRQGDGEQVANPLRTVPPGTAAPGNRTATGIIKPGASPAQESGVAALSAAEESSLEKQMVLERAAPLRLCGDVRDTNGRPVSRAQVVAAGLSRSTTSAADGRFCLDLPAGSHELVVLAMGYQQSRIDVVAGRDSAPVRVVLHAVAVLAGPVRPVPKYSESIDLFAALPDSERVAVREAQRLHGTAEATRSAAAWDAAGAAWSGVVARRAAGALGLEARYQMAETRYRAWKAEPGGERARAAIEALDGFARQAPPSARRTTALARLAEVRKASTPSGTP